jgi:UDP-N-acetylglucosamine acyltransferase
MEVTRHDSGALKLSAKALTTSIHPSVIISGKVEIADGVRIAPHCVLTGPLRIEADCQIGTGCLLGGAPEHRELDSHGTLVVGAGTVFREYCIVHHGITQQSTRIGSNCFIMNRAYIAHDCQISDDVTISAGVTLGGHVNIHRGANLGMQVAVHQRSTIGAHAMIGMLTPVCKDVPPLCLVAGNPIRLVSVNRHALGRLGLESQCLVQGESGLLYINGNEAINSMIAEFQQSSSRQRLFEIRYVASSPPRKPR